MTHPIAAKRSRYSSRSRRLGLSLAAGTVAAVAAAVWWAGATRAPAPALERLVGQCEVEMLRGVCRVQTGPGSVSPVDSVVFVAGVGRIDAGSYRRLREAGQALCGTVRETCTSDWNGPDCRAARALHGQR